MENIDKNNEIKNEKLEETKKKETLGVKDDIHVLIESKDDGVLFDENCCTIINIILNNEREIATSFYGIHNEEIIKHLIKAQKVYFKALKKALKEERKTAKNMLENDDNETKDSSNDEEFIHHIKDYQPIDENVITKESKKDSSVKNKDSVIKTNTDNTEHELSTKGKNLIKKKQTVNKKNKQTTK